MSPHNGIENTESHACARIALAIKDAHEIEISAEQVRDVIDNVSTRDDLSGDIELAILAEAYDYGISPAVGNLATCWTGRVYS